MPILKEVKERVYQQPGSMQDQLSYAQTGRDCIRPLMYSCCSRIKHFKTHVDSCMLFFRG